MKTYIHADVYELTHDEVGKNKREIEETLKAGIYTVYSVYGECEIRVSLVRQMQLYDQPDYAQNLRVTIKLSTPFNVELEDDNLKTFELMRETFENEFTGFMRRFPKRAWIGVEFGYK